MENFEKVDVSNVLNAIVGEYDKELVNWHGTDVVVNKNIPFSRMVNIAVASAHLCFDSDTGVYVDGYEELISNVAVLKAFTNIDIPDNEDSIYDLVSNTDIMSVVENTANSYQVEALRDTFYATVNRMKRDNENQIRLTIEKVSNFIDNVISVISGFVDSVSSEDVDHVKTIIAKIASTNFNEQSIVEAIVNSARQ